MELPNKKYKTIVIDPPWKYGSWGLPSDRPNQKKVRPLPYDTMTVQQIKELKVNDLAENNCELYLWVTQKYLPVSFEIITHWGFKYCQTLVWCKKPRGLGQGGLYCPTNEFLILARKGKMPKKRRIDTTWFLTKRPHNSHSTKPDYFQELIEKVSDSPRLELFARRSKFGWDVWGNEAPNFTQLSLPSADGDIIIAKSDKSNDLPSPETAVSASPARSI